MRPNCYPALDGDKRGAAAHKALILRAGHEQVTED